MEKSIAYYTKATEIDPDYAQAYTGLAYVYFHYTWENFCSRTAGFEKVRLSALRALEIDKNQAEALTILANLSCMDWKWEKARKEFMHAIECNPNVELAHRYYSFLLEMLGEQEEARRQIDLARKIDPLSLSVLWNSSASYYYSGEYEKALEELRILQEIDPSFWLTYVSFLTIYRIQGDEFRAKQAIQMIFQNGASYLHGYADSVNSIYNKSGINGLIMKLIEHEERPYWLAINYAQMNDRERVLELLEKACEMHDIQGPVYFEPLFESFRSDPEIPADHQEDGIISVS